MIYFLGFEGFQRLCDILGFCRFFSYNRSTPGFEGFERYYMAFEGFVGFSIIATSKTIIIFITNICNIFRKI